MPCISWCVNWQIQVARETTKPQPKCRVDFQRYLRNKARQQRHMGHRLLQAQRDRGTQTLSGSVHPHRQWGAPLPAPVLKRAFPCALYCEAGLSCSFMCLYTGILLLRTSRVWTLGIASGVFPHLYSWYSQLQGDFIHSSPNLLVLTPSFQHMV